MIPKVSILLPTYNRSHLLGKAIQSVLNQSFADWELLIVCDSDSDGTRAVAEEWVKRDPRIKYFEIPRAGRISIVSNFALQKSKGEYVAILDDDDWWIDRDKLRKQIDFLDQHSDHVGCGGGLVLFNEQQEEMGRILKPETHEKIISKALVANPMANSTTLFRKSSAQKVGGYDETMKEFADWDFWLKIGLEGKLYNFEEYFTGYLMWPGGSSFAKQRGAAESALRIVRRYEKKYPHRLLAWTQAGAYFSYAFLPGPIKKVLNPTLSKVKKIIFSK